MTHSPAEILTLYADRRRPVPVVEIAERLGIEVLQDPFYRHGRDGHIELGQDGRWRIIVNENMPPARKRFTIAHEIGHFLHDRDYLEQHRAMDRDGDAADATYRERERRANDFAANLLMPEDDFIQQWLALGTPERVAEYFFVSREAAQFRAINLGLAAAK